MSVKVNKALNLSQLHLDALRATNHLGRLGLREVLPDLLLPLLGKACPNVLGILVAQGSHVRPTYRHRIPFASRKPVIDGYETVLTGRLSR